MRSEEKGSDDAKAELEVRPPRAHPPKPQRPPSAPVPDEDDATVRVWLRHDAIPATTPEAPVELPAPSAVSAASNPTAASSPQRVVPVPPPLPSVSKPSEQTPLVALEIPTHRLASRFRFPGGRYAKMGAALFGAGVLVGVLGAVSVLSGRSSTTLEVAAPAAPAVPVASVAPALEAPKAVALPPAPSAPVIEPVAALPTTGEPMTGEPTTVPNETPRANDPAPDPVRPPVSASNAPSCRQLLGKSLKDRNDPKRANTQTALANRALVRGNVDEAQAAYCLAHAWDRSNIDRRLNLAKLFLIRRDWAKAAEYGQSALELDPKSRRALAVVADAWAGMHRTKEARAALLSAEQKPKATPAQIRLIVRRDLALARRVERLQDFSLAERLYRRVLLMDDEHAGAMLGMAGCLLRLGDRPAAEAWVRKAKGTKRTAAGSTPRTG